MSGRIFTKVLWRCKGDDGNGCCYIFIKNFWMVWNQLNVGWDVENYDWLCHLRVWLFVFTSLERLREKVKSSVLWFTPHTARAGTAWTSGTWTLVQGSHMVGGTNGPWTIIRCLPGNVLAGSWIGSIGVGTWARQSKMGCGCPRWQLNHCAQHLLPFQFLNAVKEAGGLVKSLMSVLTLPDLWPWPTVTL